MSGFRPLQVLRVLIEHRVEFVLIGGVAANARGSPSMTGDVDACYARTPDNLARLAEALRSLEATLRGAPKDIPFQLDAKTLKMGDAFTFDTRLGSLDCLGTPSGTRGYEDLRAGATLMDFDGLRVPVASVDDLIRMKKAAGRPKDLIEVEVLGALREELEHPDG